MVLCLHFYGLRMLLVSQTIWCFLHGSVKVNSECEVMRKDEIVP